MRSHTPYICLYASMGLCSNVICVCSWPCVFLWLLSACMCVFAACVSWTWSWKTLISPPAAAWINTNTEEVECIMLDILLLLSKENDRAACFVAVLLHNKPRSALQGSLLRTRRGRTKAELQDSYFFIFLDVRRIFLNGLGGVKTFCDIKMQSFLCFDMK